MGKNSEKRKLKSRKGETYYPKGEFMTLNSLKRCLDSFDSETLLVAMYEDDEPFRIEKVEISEYGTPILRLCKMD